MKHLFSLFMLVFLSACAAGTAEFLEFSEMDAHQLKAVDGDKLCDAYNYTGWSGSDGKNEPKIAAEVKRRKLECDPLKLACMSYGFKKNTPEFAQCIMLEKHSEDQRKAAELQNIRQQQMMNRPRHTNCHALGNSLSCTTW
jgi:hypothetical protein